MSNHYLTNNVLNDVPQIRHQAPSTCMLDSQFTIFIIFTLKKKKEINVKQKVVMVIRKPTCKETINLIIRVHMYN